MRLPLLVCGTPSIIIACPIILIPAGKWKIITENLVDSVLLPAELDFKVASIFCLQFVHKGTETNLNIYAEKIE